MRASICAALGVELIELLRQRARLGGSSASRQRMPIDMSVEAAGRIEARRDRKTQIRGRDLLCVAPRELPAAR